MELGMSGGKRKEQSTQESNRSFHPVLPTERG